MHVGLKWPFLRKRWSRRGGATSGFTNEPYTDRDYLLGVFVYPSYGLLLPGDSGSSLEGGRSHVAAHGNLVDLLDVVVHLSEHLVEGGLVVNPRVEGGKVLL